MVVKKVSASVVWRGENGEKREKAAAEWVSFASGCGGPPMPVGRIRPAAGWVPKCGLFVFFVTGYAHKKNARE